MAKLTKEQLKKLYDYGGTLSPQDWALLIDNMGTGGSNSESDYDESGTIVSTTYSELKDSIESNGLVPGRWYQFEHNPYIPTLGIAPCDKETFVRVQATSTNQISSNAIYCGVNEAKYGIDTLNKGLYYRPCKYDINKFNNIIVKKDYTYKYVMPTAQFIGGKHSSSGDGVYNMFIDIFEKKYGKAEFISEYEYRYDYDSACDVTSAIVFNKNYKVLVEIQNTGDGDYDVIDTRFESNMYIYDPYECTGFVYDIELPTGFLSYDISTSNILIGDNFTFKSDNTLRVLDIPTNGLPEIAIRDCEIINSNVRGYILLYSAMDIENMTASYSMIGLSFKKIIDSNIEVEASIHAPLALELDYGTLEGFGYLIGCNGLINSTEIDIYTHYIEQENWYDRDISLTSYEYLSKEIFNEWDEPIGVKTYIKSINP